MYGLLFIPTLGLRLVFFNFLSCISVRHPKLLPLMVRVGCLLLAATGLAVVPTCVALLPPPFLPHTAGAHSVRNSARVRQEEGGVFCTHVLSTMIVNIREVEIIFVR